MKEFADWVKIKKYTDDGKPVCGNLSAGPKCVHLAWDGDWAVFMCQYQVAAKPGPTCPIWHGESKSEWQPIQGEPIEPGYYWWLPVCSSGNAHEPSHWNIVSWHPKDGQRQKSGTFVGPISLPSPPQEK